MGWPNILPNFIHTDSGITETGWDKIFYFVGADAFSQKFCPKQREIDATEDVQISGNLGISSSDKKFLTVA